MFSLDQIPPVADKRPKVDVIHGDTRVDDYYWLREKGAFDVTAYLEAENAFTNAVTAELKPLEDSLYTEILGRIQETDLSVPYRKDGYLYYTRTEEGKQYPIYCRRPVTDPAAPDGAVTEQVTLDLNQLAEGKPFLSLGAYSVSDDGKLLAFTTDETGFREYTLQIKDLQTETLLPDKILKVDEVAWASDNKTLLYTTEDDAKRAYRLYSHTVGASDNSTDNLHYEDPDGLFRVFLQRTRDKSYFILGSASFTTTECWFLGCADLAAPLTLIRKRQEGHEYYPDFRDGLLYIRTNESAVNFRLVTAPIVAPGVWTELVPHRVDVMLADHDCFANHLVATERAGGLPRLRIRRFDNGEEHEVTFPEPTYTVSGDTNREFETNLFRIRYASLITPLSIFDYDMNTRRRELLKETPVLGGYDRTQYVSEYVHARAADGTAIPISVIYKKGAPLDGSAPTLLYGYGSYGISIPAGFSPNRLSLLDRGFVYAIAHIRGGGELGKPWHDAGKMKNKWNTFDDFIAAAEFLIAEKYTSAGRLAIMGGSAGGLLMGAVTNKRLDLFRVVISVVPFVDVVNTMLDDTLPLTIGEYVEWGNPQVKEDYDYIKTYCPYTNLHGGSYPTILVRTSLNDSQVMYWEPAKYVAKLRTLKTNAENPLLFRINMAAGHGGSSGRYDALREAAFDYAFLLTALGVSGQAR